LFITKLVPIFGHQHCPVKKLEARNERLLEDRYQGVRAMASRAEKLDQLARARAEKDLLKLLWFLLDSSFL